MLHLLVAVFVFPSFLFGHVPVAKRVPVGGSAVAHHQELVRQEGLRRQAKVVESMELGLGGVGVLQDVLEAVQLEAGSGYGKPSGGYGSPSPPKNEPGKEPAPPPDVGDYSEGFERCIGVSHPLLSYYGKSARQGGGGFRDSKSMKSEIECKQSFYGPSVRKLSGVNCNSGGAKARAEGFTDCEEKNGEFKSPARRYEGMRVNTNPIDAFRNAAQADLSEPAYLPLKIADALMEDHRSPGGYRNIRGIQDETYQKKSTIWGDGSEFKSNNYWLPLRNLDAADGGCSDELYYNDGGGGREGISEWYFADEDFCVDELTPSASCMLCFGRRGGHQIKKGQCAPVRPCGYPENALRLCKRARTGVPSHTTMKIINSPTSGCMSKLLSFDQNSVDQNAKAQIKGTPGNACCPNPVDPGSLWFTWKSGGGVPPDWLGVGQTVETWRDVGSKTKSLFGEEGVLQRTQQLNWTPANAAALETAKAAKAARIETILLAKQESYLFQSAPEEEVDSIVLSLEVDDESVDLSIEEELGRLFDPKVVKRTDAARHNILHIPKNHPTRNFMDDFIENHWLAVNDVAPKLNTEQVSALQVSALQLGSYPPKRVRTVAEGLSSADHDIFTATLADVSGMSPHILDDKFGTSSADVNILLEEDLALETETETEAGLRGLGFLRQYCIEASDGSKVKAGFTLDTILESIAAGEFLGGDSISGVVTCCVVDLVSSIVPGNIKVAIQVLKFMASLLLMCLRLTCLYLADPPPGIDGVDTNPAMAKCMSACGVMRVIQQTLLSHKGLAAAVYGRTCKGNRQNFIDQTMQPSYIKGLGGPGAAKGQFKISELHNVAQKNIADAKAKEYFEHSSLFKTLGLGADETVINRDNIEFDGGPNVKCSAQLKAKLDADADKHVDGKYPLAKTLKGQKGTSTAQRLQDAGMSPKLKKSKKKLGFAQFLMKAFLNEVANSIAIVCPTCCRELVAHGKLDWPWNFKVANEARGGTDDSKVEAMSLNNCIGAFFLQMFTRTIGNCMKIWLNTLTPAAIAARAAKQLVKIFPAGRVLSLVAEAMIPCMMYVLRLVINACVKASFNSWHNDRAFMQILLDVESDESSANGLTKTLCGPDVKRENCPAARCAFELYTAMCLKTSDNVLMIRRQFAFQYYALKNGGTGKKRTDYIRNILRGSKTGTGFPDNINEWDTFRFAGMNMNWLAHNACFKHGDEGGHGVSGDSRFWGSFFWPFGPNPDERTKFWMGAHESNGVIMYKNRKPSDKNLVIKAGTLSGCVSVKYWKPMTELEHFKFDTQRDHTDENMNPKEKENFWVCDPEYREYWTSTAGGLWRDPGANHGGPTDDGNGNSMNGFGDGAVTPQGGLMGNCNRIPRFALPCDYVNECNDLSRPCDGNFADGGAWPQRFPDEPCSRCCPGKNGKDKQSGTARCSPHGYIQDWRTKEYTNVGVWCSMCDEYQPSFSRESLWKAPGQIQDQGCCMGHRHNKDVWSTKEAPPYFSHFDRTQREIQVAKAMGLAEEDCSDEIWEDPTKPRWLPGIKLKSWQKTGRTTQSTCDRPYHGTGKNYHKHCGRFAQWQEKRYERGTGPQTMGNNGRWQHAGNFGHDDDKNPIVSNHMFKRVCWMLNQDVTVNQACDSTHWDLVVDREHCHFYSPNLNTEGGITNQHSKYPHDFDAIADENTSWEWHNMKNSNPFRETFQFYPSKDFHKSAWHVYTQGQKSTDYKPLFKRGFLRDRDAHTGEELEMCCGDSNAAIVETLFRLKHQLVHTGYGPRLNTFGEDYLVTAKGQDFACKNCDRSGTTRTGWRGMRGFPLTGTPDVTTRRVALDDYEDGKGCPRSVGNELCGKKWVSERLDFCNSVKYATTRRKTEKDGFPVPNECKARSDRQNYNMYSHYGQLGNNGMTSIMYHADYNNPECYEQEYFMKNEYVKVGEMAQKLRLDDPEVGIGDKMHKVGHGGYMDDAADLIFPSIGHMPSKHERYFEMGHTIEYGFFDRILYGDDYYVPRGGICSTMDEFTDFVCSRSWAKQHHSKICDVQSIIKATPGTVGKDSPATTASILAVLQAAHDCVSNEGLDDCAVKYCGQIKHLYSQFKGELSTSERKEVQDLIDNGKICEPEEPEPQCKPCARGQYWGFKYYRNASGRTSYNWRTRRYVGTYLYGSKCSDDKSYGTCCGTYWEDRGGYCFYWAKAANQNYCEDPAGSGPWVRAQCPGNCCGKKICPSRRWTRPSRSNYWTGTCGPENMSSLEEEEDVVSAPEEEHLGSLLEEEALVAPEEEHQGAPTPEDCIVNPDC